MNFFYTSISVYARGAPVVWENGSHFHVISESRCECVSAENTQAYDDATTRADCVSDVEKGNVLKLMSSRALEDFVRLRKHSMRRLGTHSALENTR